MRESYCTEIENALVGLRERSEIRVASNLTDMLVYAEPVMVSVLDPIFGLNLESANTLSH